MGPPLTSFPVSELHHHLNTLPSGKRRKGGDIDLAKCEPLELVQYECYLKKGETPNHQAVIQCRPVVKQFRKYIYSQPHKVPSAYIYVQMCRRPDGGDNRIGDSE